MTLPERFPETEQTPMRSSAHIAYGVASAPHDGPAGHEGDATSLAVPQPGEVLDGKYRIEGTLGQGGMAVVLAATHLHLEERVAIKVLLPQWAEDPEFVERFMREGRSAIKIRSEHVVRVLDVGVIEGRPYLVMEYLEGSDLDQLLASGGPLPVHVAVDYLLQASEAIAEAHASGIIHRDLKPANLFLTHRADGSPAMKVLDFGISKLMNSPRSSGVDMRTTQPSMVMGSPHYMSPEQMASARDVDERTDIWAIGAILHELLAGAPPFKGDTITALCATILKDAPAKLTTYRADVPPSLEAIIAKCLEKDPAARFANVADLAFALADYGSPSARASAERIRRVLDAVGDTQAAAPWSTPPAPHRSRVASLKDSLATPPSRRGHVFGYLVGALALVLVGSGIGFMIVQNGRAAHASAAHDEPVLLTNGKLPIPPAAATAATTPALDVATPHARPASTATLAPVAVPAVTNPPSPPAAPVARGTSAPPRTTHGPQRTPHRAPAEDAPLPSFPVPSAAIPADAIPSLLPPTAAPAPAPSGTAPTTPDQLFDDRK
jgi:serine/threonine protein kinase